MYSPAVPMFDGRSGGNFMAGSPFSSVAMVADGLPDRSHFGGVGGGESYPANMELVRSASVHGWSSDLLNRSPLPESQDRKLDGNKDAATLVTRDVSRRDMVTQIIREGSECSSPKGVFLLPIASLFLSHTGAKESPYISIRSLGCSGG